MTTEAYDQFHALTVDRYSCRKYLPDTVSRDMLLAIIETARLAPSACNKQPWLFIVADTPELCREIASCYERDWVDNVPAFIVACGTHNEAWHRADGKDHTDVDLSIAIEHMCLAASTLGLGTCWICNFDEPKLSQTLNLPDGTEPIALIPVGYPDPSAPVPGKKRKSVEEIMRWGKF